MYKHREEIYSKSPPTGDLIFVGDIGGTNSNFACVTHEDNKLRLLISLHLESQQITDFSDAVKWVLAYLKDTYKLEPKRVCLAGAGVYDHEKQIIYVTNASWDIHADEIKTKTGLEDLFLINDFEAIGYGIDYLESDKLVMLHPGTLGDKGTRAILGAGTGLGQCAMVWCNKLEKYISVASEGGHTNFAVGSDDELKLCQFIQEELGENFCVSWEDVLAGKGISALFRFMREKKKFPDSDLVQDVVESGYDPALIMSYATDDPSCGAVAEWYLKLYARCARNVALHFLSSGGLYIAGGIAAKNVSLFENKTFVEAFVHHRTRHHFLQAVPISIVTDYNVSLYGAAAYVCC